MRRRSFPVISSEAEAEVPVTAVAAAAAAEVAAHADSLSPLCRLLMAAEWGYQMQEHDYLGTGERTKLAQMTNKQSLTKRFKNILFCAIVW
jgi:hypothetical protein